MNMWFRAIEGAGGEFIDESIEHGTRRVPADRASPPARGSEAAMTPKLPPIPDEAKARFDQIKASGGEPRYYMRMGKVRVRDVAKEKPRGSHSAVRKKIALVDQVAAMLAEREATGESYATLAERLIKLIKRRALEH